MSNKELRAKRRKQQREAFRKYILNIPKISDSWTGWKRDLLLERLKCDK